MVDVPTNDDMIEIFSVWWRREWIRGFSDNESDVDVPNAPKMNSELILEYIFSWESMSYRDTKITGQRDRFIGNEGIKSVMTVKRYEKI